MSRFKRHHVFGKVMMVLAFLILLFGSSNANSDKIFPRSWDYLGPFSIGKVEFDGDPVASYGSGNGITAVARNRSFTPPFFSEMPQSGTIHDWARLRTGPNGEIDIRPDGVDWNNLVSTTSSMEVLENQGWAVGDFEVKKAGRYSVWCGGLNTIYIARLDPTSNEEILVPFIGDQYHSGAAKGAVSLQTGTATLYAHVRAKVNTRFSCHLQGPLRRHKTKKKAPLGLLPPSPLLEVSPPLWLPDLVGDCIMGDGAISLRVFNAGEMPRSLRARVLADAEWGLSVAAVDEGVMEIVSGQSAHIPLKLSTHRLESTPSIWSLCHALVFDLVIEHKVSDKEEWGSAEVLSKLTLRCREPNQSFIFSFIDHDGTASRAAAVAPPDEVLRLKKKKKKPKAKSDGRKVPVLLSLHGTGISPSDQADSYKRKDRPSQQDYTFGVEGYWVCAPTRHGAHNWEHTGHLTALAAADALESMTSSDHWAASFPRASSRHVLYTGHSMGGHGAWVLGALHPSRAIGVVSSAGWLSKEFYGDSNTPWMHDIGGPFVESRLRALMMATVAEHTATQVQNFIGLEVLARVGASDRTVPPYFARRMVRLLQGVGLGPENTKQTLVDQVLLSDEVLSDSRRNKNTTECNSVSELDIGLVNVSINELPGKDHWWWDTETENDGGVTNDKQMRSAYSSVRAHCHEYEQISINEQPEVTKTEVEILSKFDRFEMVSYNPATFSGRLGVKPLQHVVPFARATVVFVSQVAVGLNLTEIRCFKLETNNVRRLSISRASPVLFCSPSIVDVDGSKVPLLSSGPVHVCRDDYSREWVQCLDIRGVDESSFEKWERGARTSGPARQVSARPFAVVVPEMSDNHWDTTLRDLGVYISNLHAMAADTFAPVISAHFSSLHRNTIVLGSPIQNHFHDMLANQNNTAAASAVRWSQDGSSFTIDNLPCNPFDEPGTAVVYLSPFWDEQASSDMKDEQGDGGTARLTLVVAGTDEKGSLLAARLAQPTIPPMTRAPFTNLVPDWIVLGPEAWSMGLGGVRAAGFWGNRWEYSPSTSYVNC